MSKDIRRDLGALKCDVKKLSDHTAELVTKVADAGKDRVESAVDNSKKIVKDATNSMKKNPIATVAGAVGAGVILGGILKRMFRRRR